ncbi:MAG: class I SAM-dependent methyltransferase [Alphaproteobacteria bacterium HGW-Alphaproteobacteria-17]|nr:MAG: class I SAM-dependent methyltransferase [Alphaproteobacteria bacterium HGW-Alphaproteobacteria-17]
MSEALNFLVCPCPHHAALISVADGRLACSDSECPCSDGKGGFLYYQGIPVLINFSGDTLCERQRYIDSGGERDVYVKRRIGILKTIVERMTGAQSPVTRGNCVRFVSEIKAMSTQPRVLVIGSGEQGQGTSDLWQDAAIERVGIDIYPTATTNYIADAHHLPFRDASFDGVWIQAVLEHVADPVQVVAEIERVLKTGGVVYAETPFMQQVHEGAYDFQRFSVTGHRFLFRRFNALAIGGNKGPGVVLAWAIRYFVWGLFRSRRLAVLLSYPTLTVLRLVDRLMDPRALWDGPSGVFFLGQKGDGTPMPQRDLPRLYEGFQQ